MTPTICPLSGATLLGCRGMSYLKSIWLTHFPRWMTSQPGCPRASLVNQPFVDPPLPSPFRLCILRKQKSFDFRPHWPLTNMFITNIYIEPATGLSGGRALFSIGHTSYPSGNVTSALCIYIYIYPTSTILRKIAPFYHPLCMKSVLLVVRLFC